MEHTFFDQQGRPADELRHSKLDAKAAMEEIQALPDSTTAVRLDRPSDATPDCELHGWFADRPAGILFGRGSEGFATALCPGCRSDEEQRKALAEERARAAKAAASLPFLRNDYGAKAESEYEDRNPERTEAWREQQIALGRMVDPIAEAQALARMDEARAVEMKRDGQKLAADPTAGRRFIHRHPCSFPY